MELAANDTLKTRIRKAVHDLQAKGNHVGAEAVWDLWDAYQEALNNARPKMGKRQDGIQAFRSVNALLGSNDGSALEATQPELTTRDSLGSPLRSCMDCERIQRTDRDWNARCAKHTPEPGDE